MNKIKIGDTVKVIECIDKAVPYEPSLLLGWIGVVTGIDRTRPSPITVYFAKLGTSDSFWDEELDIKKGGVG